jgi:hypothetical protein
MTKGIEIREEIVQELLAGYERPEDLLGKDGLFVSLVKKLDTKKAVLKGDFTAAPATAVRTRQA